MNNLLRILSEKTHGQILRNVFGLFLWFLSISAPELAANETSKPTQQVATGFFVSDAGYLVTAHHVIANLPDIRVVLSPRRVLRAQTVKVNEESDLALLKVDAITPFMYLSHPWSPLYGRYHHGLPAGERAWDYHQSTRGRATASVG